MDLIFSGRAGLQTHLPARDGHGGKLLSQKCQELLEGRRVFHRERHGSRNAPPLFAILPHIHHAGELGRERWGRRDLVRPHGRGGVPASPPGTKEILVNHTHLPARGGHGGKLLSQECQELLEGRGFLLVELLALLAPNLAPSLALLVTLPCRSFTLNAAPVHVDQKLIVLVVRPVLEPRRGPHGVIVNIEHLQALLAAFLRLSLRRAPLHVEVKLDHLLLHFLDA